MKISENAVEILNYNDNYKEDLKRLTLEWLEKGFIVEPEDLKFIENPTNYVIDNGGFIFLARRNNEIVGTVSLFKVENNKYELAKLAVTEKYQGLKLGKRLMHVAIDKCIEIAAEQVILYTTKKLEAAYNLYVRLGFVEIKEEKPKYIDADVIMELDLTK
ncbi:MAG: GNAT family N-acetyltransferase [Balneolaceae bacterium]|nr:GNAT family N-acetyltransferase [Balneolaceae bacterium]